MLYTIKCGNLFFQSENKVDCILKNQYNESMGYCTVEQYKENCKNLNVSINKYGYIIQPA